jgi:hypothetical protein
LSSPQCPLSLINPHKNPQDQARSNQASTASFVVSSLISPFATPFSSPITGVVESSGARKSHSPSPISPPAAFEPPEIPVPLILCPLQIHRPKALVEIFEFTVPAKEFVKLFEWDIFSEVLIEFEFFSYDGIDEGERAIQRWGLKKRKEARQILIAIEAYMGGRE